MKKIFTLIAFAVMLAWHPGNADAQKKRSTTPRATTQRGTEQRNATLQKYFKRNSVTFSYNNVGIPTEDSARGFAQLGFEPGDIGYKCLLHLGSNGKGTFTFTMYPTKQTRSNGRIHYRNDGARLTHAEYIQDFCNKINQMEDADGAWRVVDNEDFGRIIELGEYKFKPQEGTNTLTWLFLENCKMTMVK